VGDVSRDAKTTVALLSGYALQRCQEVADAAAVRIWHASSSNGVGDAK